MISTYTIDINETKKLTQGQGHKVKGQGQICNYENNVFRVLKTLLHPHIWIGCKQEVALA